MSNLNAPELGFPEVSLRKVIDILRQKWKQLILGAVIGCALGSIAPLFIKPKTDLKAVFNVSHLPYDYGGSPQNLAVFQYDLYKVLYDLREKYGEDIIRFTDFNPEGRLEVALISKDVAELDAAMKDFEAQLYNDSRARFDRAVKMLLTSLEHTRALVENGRRQLEQYSPEKLTNDPTSSRAVIRYILQTHQRDFEGQAQRMERLKERLSDKPISMITKSYKTKNQFSLAPLVGVFAGVFVALFLILGRIAMGSK